MKNFNKAVSKHYKKPNLTVDAVIKKDNSVILIKRKNNPFKGAWAIPGGFVEYNETVESAVVREAKEETGLDVKIEKLAGVYSDPKRDPRGHTVSVVFLCGIIGGKMKADTDASDVREFDINSLQGIELAFDHRKILREILLINPTN